MSDRAPLNRQNLRILESAVRHGPHYFGFETRQSLLAQARAYLDLRDRLEALVEDIRIEADRDPGGLYAQGLCRAESKIRAALREPLESGADHD